MRSLLVGRDHVGCLYHDPTKEAFIYLTSKVISASALRQRHSVLVPVVGQSPSPGNGAGGEHGTAVGGLVEHHIAAHERAGLTRVGRMRMRQFLLHPVIDRRELCGRGHHERMGRRAQGAVGTVDLPPGGTTANQAKIANPLGGANAFEDERHAWVKALRGAFIKGGDVKTMRGHPRASYR